MMKKTFAVILLILLLAGCAVPSFAEDIPEPGLDAALRKAQEFNEWMRQRTDDEIAAEMHISRWDVLSPYGTEAPPDPLIEVSEGDTWDDLLQRPITTAVPGKNTTSMPTGIWCLPVCSRSR